ncbi:MAG: UvrD-helicase domain-containing protein, partial [Gammaproteobacteria bacterium]|nr:UvrD-helicase domain-containing protein [Gammaproteobacteria bacterium]
MPTPSSPHLNATVMASAGTGKTYMLVNRLVRLLLAGAKPDAILAITFTRKAAAEMQSRLSERLLALASAPPEELAERLREMGVDPSAQSQSRAQRLFETLLQNRQQVRTTTFHAFCQEILLRFPLEADVPPGFELLESGAEQLEAAHNTLLTEASNEPEGAPAAALQRLLDYCGGLHGMQRALSSFIAHRGDWWAYTEQATDPVDFATEQLQQQLQIDPAADPLQAFFSERRVTALGEFSALLAKHPNKGNDDALQALATARHPDTPLGERFAASREAFLTQKGSPRVRKASQVQARKMGTEGEQRFLALHEELSQAVLETLDQLTAHRSWHACRDWYLAGARLLHHYQQLKQEQRVLDFNDLEWRAYHLLNHSDNALWVQYKLDQRIDHLLVDEFQDTNPTQWRLLLPLLQEMAATRTQESLRSVFLVGDAKQSIYRFRRAEPRLFQAAHDWLEQHLDARAFPLHTSWRSAPAIMQCVNKVFDEHGPLAGQLRDFQRHDTHHSELWGEVTVLPLIEAKETAEEKEEKQEEYSARAESLRNPLLQPREIAPDDRYRREGEQIAGAITRLLESGTLIGHGDNAYPIHPGDIMLLVRKRTHIGYYEQALRDARIPYLGAERGTLLQSLEVSDMVALLELLHTPYNNLSLATVLRTPLFACSDGELMQLAQSGKGGWYQRLQTLAPTLPDETPLAVAAVTLQRWHALAGQIPIHDLLDRIFSEGNVLQRYQAALPSRLASVAVANLTRFLELALEVDSGRYPSLGHFLARLEGMRDSSDEAPDEAPETSAGSRVRLLTIHAAKGLEAPVVFLADTAQGDGSDKAYRTLLEWPPHSARPESFMLIGKQEQQPLLARRQLEREQLEQQRESANLLYVALTRARQLLYISGVRPASGREPGWYGALRTALDPLEETPAEQPCLLSSGQPPRPGTMPAPTAQEQTGEPCDPRLSQPLERVDTSHEIAPSYQEGAPQMPGAGGDEDGRLRGIVIHRLLQLLSEQSATQWPLLAPRIAAEFGLEADDAQFLRWYRECRQLLQAPHLANIFMPGKGVESLNETPIIYTFRQQTVHGVIDRLLLKQDAIWLIDYKTHRHASENSIASLAEGFRQQLAYYAGGIGQLWPKRPVRSFLLFTSPGIL